MTALRRDRIILAVLTTAIILMAAGLVYIGLEDNQSPDVPVVDAGPDLYADVGQSVYFTANASVSNGTIVKYEWDFDGDGVFDWSSTENISTIWENGRATWRYDRAGTYDAVVRVTSDRGAQATDNCTVFVTDRLKLDIYLDRTEFKPGQDINVTVSLTNVGSESVNVSELCFTCNVVFTITSPNGSLINRPEIVMPSIPPTTTLEPNETMTQTTNIAVNIGKEHDLHEEGEYSVRCRYTSFNAYDISWYGRLYSDTLILTIAT